MSTLTHNAREITGGRSHIRSGLSLYARYKASPTVLRGGTIAESKKNRVKKPFKKSEVSSKHPENPASMPQIDPITSETMIPSPIVSDLTSEEIEESYRIYKEAVQLGLVPTSKDIEENVALATNLRNSIVGFYVCAIILSYFVTWLVVSSMMISSADEVISKLAAQRFANATTTRRGGQTYRTTAIQGNPASTFRFKRSSSARDRNVFILRKDFV